MESESGVADPEAGDGEVCAAQPAATSVARSVARSVAPANAKERRTVIER
jgi:hypothetical protein